MLLALGLLIGGLAVKGIAEIIGAVQRREDTERQLQQAREVVDAESEILEGQRDDVIEDAAEQIGFAEAEVAITEQTQANLMTEITNAKEMINKQLEINEKNAQASIDSYSEKIDLVGKNIDFIKSQRAAAKLDLRDTERQLDEELESTLAAGKASMAASGLSTSSRSAVEVAGRQVVLHERAERQLQRAFDLQSEQFDLSIESQRLQRRDYRRAIRETNRASQLAAMEAENRLEELTNTGELSAEKAELMISRIQEQMDGLVINEFDGEVTDAELQLQGLNLQLLQNKQSASNIDYNEIRAKQNMWLEIGGAVGDTAMSIGSTLVTPVPGQNYSFGELPKTLANQAAVSYKQSYSKQGLNIRNKPRQRSIISGG